MECKATLLLAPSQPLASLSITAESAGLAGSPELILIEQQSSSVWDLRSTQVNITGKVCAEALSSAIGSVRCDTADQC